MKTNSNKNFVHQDLATEPSLTKLAFKNKFAEPDHSSQGRGFSAKTQLQKQGSSNNNGYML